MRFELLILFFVDQRMEPEKRPSAVATRPGMKPKKGEKDFGLCCGERGSILACRMLMVEGWWTERGA